MRRQQGLSLTELLIALVVGLVITARTLLLEMSSASVSRRVSSINCRRVPVWRSASSKKILRKAVFL